MEFKHFNIRWRQDAGAGDGHGRGCGRGRGRGHGHGSPKAASVGMERGHWETFRGWTGML